MRGRNDIQRPYLSRIATKSLQQRLPEPGAGGGGAEIPESARAPRIIYPPYSQDKQQEHWGEVHCNIKVQF